MSKRKAKYTGGYKTTDMLPDHASTLKRKQHWTRSDILHAAPEKAAQIINDILAGRGTLS